MNTDHKGQKIIKLIFGRTLSFQQVKKQHQKVLFYLFVSVGIPVLVLFSIFHILSQNYMEGVLDGAVACFLGGCYLSFKVIKRVKTIYFMCVALVGLLFLYLGYDGGGHGSKLLWMYLFPLIAFFMTGRAVGGLFSAAGLVAVGIIFFSQEMIWFRPYPYENDIKIRFMVTYAIVTILTFIFEYVRYHFQKGMEREQALLLEKQEALTRANAEIRILSLSDHLTGCYNRLYLNKYLSMEIRRCQRYSKPLSIIMCDIDYFKKINDTYGHQAGDSVLKAVALSLRTQVRENIDWVVRYGGEEFMIVLPETELEEAMVVADRLLHAVSATVVDTKDHAINVTASFGVASTGTEQSRKYLDLDAFVNIADRLLYDAKTQGRNRVVSESCPGQPGGTTH
jgi:diguanylate cyclase (GGDEF)-like protein